RSRSGPNYTTNLNGDAACAGRCTEPARPAAWRDTSAGASHANNRRQSGSPARRIRDLVHWAHFHAPLPEEPAYLDGLHTHPKDGRNPFPEYIAHHAKRSIAAAQGRARIEAARRYSGAGGHSDPY